MRSNSDATVEFTKNQINLRIVEGRINSIRANTPQSSELARYEFIRKDIMATMPKEELDFYIKATTTKLTQAQIKANNEAMLAAMNENRDSPSI